MLRIDFTGLRSKYPNLSSAADELERWLLDHTHLSHIDSARVIADRPQLRPWELAEALRILVDDGELKRVYGVLDPFTGTLVNQFYDSPGSIPERLTDRLAISFDVDDAEIVPLYKERSR